MKRILGLDLSLTRTGWASSAVTWGVLVPFKGFEHGVPRLDWIMRRVLELAAGVDLVVVEGYSFGSNMAGARAIAELGGLVRWALWRKQVQVVEVPPSNLKKYAAGKGNAGKEEVLAAAIRRLEYSGHDNNEADALWLWQMAADQYGFGAGVVPQSHREGLVKVKWPELRARVA